MNSTHLIRLLLALCALPCVASAQDTNLVWLAGREVHPTRILVKFKAEVPEQAHGAMVQSEGMRVRRHYRTDPRLMCLDEAQPGRATSLTVEQRTEALRNRMEALRRTGKFEYVEPDYVVRPTLQPSDEAFQDGTLWGLRNTARPGVDIGAETAWDATTGSSDVVVGVIDTGIRYTHEELASQMWINDDEIPDNGIDDDNDGYVDNIYGINAAEDNGDPFDNDDHGTHVSGTIGAQANGGGPHVGVAWNVRLMALKFLNPYGFTSDAIECLEFALQEGVKISNNSWGGGGYSQAMYDMLERARDAGHLFIAAAGNDGSNNDLTPSYPNGYDLDNVVSVAALDRNDRLANFSNYGSETVDLGAPGVEIYSCTAGSDTEYSVFQGTSMASPHVTGVAALLLAQSPSASYFELRERLLTTTVPVAELAGKCVTGGRVNAANALGGSPDGVLEISVNPSSGQAVLSPSTQPIVVIVNDFFSVTNATVLGYVTNNGIYYTNLVFGNEGTPPDTTAGDGQYAANLVIPSLVSNIQMQLLVTAPDKLPDARQVNYFPVVLPLNDNFTNAIKIGAGGGTFTTSSKNATMEDGEPRHGGVLTVNHSLWYNWSPSASGQAIVDPAGSSFDTVVAVYTGGFLTNLTAVASADDVGSIKQGYLFFNAVAGTTYRIAIAGKRNGQEGLVRLRALVGGVPDTNAPTVAITGPPSGATLATNFVYLTGTAFDPTPNASGVSEISVRVNSASAGKLAFGTTNWQTPLFLPQGFNTIQVAAFDYAGNQSTPVSWSLTVVPPASNNHFVNGQVISNSFSGTFSADTASMNKEFGEPNHANNEGGHSAWWILYPPADGLLTLATTNSNFDTLVGLYTGSAVGALTEVASNDDAAPDEFGSLLQHAVLSNQVYRIAVDGYAGASGIAVLDYWLSPLPVYVVTVSNSAGGSVTPGSGSYASNSIVNLTATADPGYDFVGWTGSMSSLDNPLVFNVTNSVTLTAQFTPTAYSDDFESGAFNTNRLDWDVTVDAQNVPWFVTNSTASTGSYSARSGVIGNSKTSKLKLEFISSGGLGSFDVRVSSEPGWDFLRFYVNGSLKGQWSGEVGWLTYQFAAIAGTNLLEWRYVKDAAGAGGEDAAFIDNLQLPLTATTLVLTNVSWGAFDVLISGSANQTVYIQASTNAVQWATISTNQPTAGVVQFVDPAASQHAARYYRALAPVQ